MLSLKRLKLSFKLIVVLVLVVLILIIVPTTLSKYQSISSSNANVDIAFYIISSSMQTENLVMKEIGPSTEPYIYTFSVSNFDDDKRLETKAKYNIMVKTTTNMPFVYKLYKVNGTNLEDVSLNERVITDEDGMYFRIIETSDYEFGFEEKTIDLYQLYIYYPKEYSTYEYQNIVENISITIDSKQILESY